MNAIQLELEKIIEELVVSINLNDDLLVREDNDVEEREYYYGKVEAYTDAKKKCERLLEVVTGVYPESQLENIQE